VYSFSFAEHRTTEMQSYYTAITTTHHFQQIYGPYLLLLPVEKLAVIVLDTTLNGILQIQNQGIPLVKAAIDIADLLEAEVRVGMWWCGVV
jgi:mannitol-specific phosphotransferase system IIBC component